jgi:excisionase family DNA binding protein
MTNEGLSDRLLTVREVAKILHVAPSTIYRMTRERAIPGAFQIMSSWRFSLGQLDRWTKTVEYRAALGMTKTERE